MQGLHFAQKALETGSRSKTDSLQGQLLAQKFRGGACCDSGNDSEHKICKVLSGCITIRSKTPTFTHVTGLHEVLGTGVESGELKIGWAGDGQWAVRCLSCTRGSWSATVAANGGATAAGGRYTHGDIVGIPIARASSHSPRITGAGGGFPADRGPTPNRLRRRRGARHDGGETEPLRRPG